MSSDSTRFFKARANSVVVRFGISARSRARFPASIPPQRGSVPHFHRKQRNTRSRNTVNRLLSGSGDVSWNVISQLPQATLRRSLVEPQFFCTFGRRFHKHRVDTYWIPFSSRVLSARTLNVRYGCRQTHPLPPNRFPLPNSLKATTRLPGTSRHSSHGRLPSPVRQS